ncbi:ATP-binding cassette domain-containing protein [Chitinophaga sedimenti]|uniref:ATP-binding cassette domain-containing protein n=1 Tax=Chitinophaga sedimenti TaxID=2033606 RepID=UPI00249EFE2D|nr:ATP-binding cassette domain-containing protein [Chitinophaga sedimenti]
MPVELTFERSYEFTTGYGHPQAGRSGRSTERDQFYAAGAAKIAIAGESGSGKSTLLKIVAGLGQATSGQVWFNGKKVKGIHEKLMPGHPGIAYLSQHYELRNNYRVEEELAYANLFLTRIPQIYTASVASITC